MPTAEQVEQINSLGGLLLKQPIEELMGRAFDEINEAISSIETDIELTFLEKKFLTDFFYGSGEDINDLKKYEDFLQTTAQSDDLLFNFNFLNHSKDTRRMSCTKQLFVAHSGQFLLFVSKSSSPLIENDVVVVSISALGRQDVFVEKSNRNNSDMTCKFISDLHILHAEGKCGLE
ncbi:MAG: hypothetical protein LBU65_17100 [Planctomycetaceae bacterium]|jgi:hypothetical protein|nr:hypothetical protein [Planctomycetaceae bacterium]